MKDYLLKYQVAEREGCVFSSTQRDRARINPKQRGLSNLGYLDLKPVGFFNAQSRYKTSLFCWAIRSLGFSNANFPVLLPLMTVFFFFFEERSGQNDKIIKDDNKTAKNLCFMGLKKKVIFIGDERLEREIVFHFFFFENNLQKISLIFIRVFVG